jgi:diguanylate cyclase (GGDEF)-like protein
MSGLTPGLDKVADELRAWLEALRLALGARTSSLWTLTHGGDRLTVQLSTPAGVKVAPSQVPIQGHALGWVVSEGVSLRASREDTFRRSAGGWIVAAPVAEPQGERVGCVSLEFDGMPRPDAPQALELAARLAGRLMGDVRESQRALADLQKYRALYGTVHDLERELDLYGLAAGICQRGRGVSGARAAVVAAWSPGGKRGRVIATDGAAVRGLVNAVFEAGSSFLGLALDNATPLPRDDLSGKSKLPLYVEGFDSKAGSAIIAPFLVESEPIGALAVEWDRPRQFTDSDLDRVLALAAFVAGTFRNAVEFGEIRALSLTDSLTGLPNRRSTERALATSFAEADRTGKPFGVAIIDIDHFKRLNDRYGHDAGDLVLRNVAHLIRDGLRPGDHAGRWGGEEFLIVLPSTALEDAARVVERIRRSVELSRVNWGGRPIAATLSAGVSAYPEVVGNAEAVVSSADAALYRAKRSGRNAVALADTRR